MNDALRSPLDGRFIAGRRGPVDHHLPRPAIQAAGSAGNSIARCDDRTHNRQLADSDAVVTGCTTDRDPNPSTANNATTNEDDDASMRVTRSGECDLLAVVTDADGNSATYLDADPGAGAVRDDPE